jgi:DNA ligase D-like protein (predicted 3'-phosphoesterase)
MKAGKDGSRRTSLGPKGGKARSRESRDKLGTYRVKRDFKKTPEPEGRERAGKTVRGLVYIIQRHEASRLHFDLRLEREGVLLSWAVPKPPPETEGLRRLAVRTEDHPLSYGDFEGVIPEGEYGAGRVEVWDKGTYLPLEQTREKFILEIKGKRLKGPYALVKLKPRVAGDKNWLFFKIKSRAGES